MVYTFTPEELSKYDGVKDKKIYFSVRGKVYDVSKAPDFYGPGAFIRATREVSYKPNVKPRGCPGLNVAPQDQDTIFPIL